jgi:predicted ATP-dependent endonuclease of OLD family
VKLRKVLVQEFRSIWDSGEFEVGDITCLVGKNEAGKTAILTALHRLNPINDGDAKFDVTADYPRSAVEDYRHAVESEERDGAEVVRATFELDDGEIASVGEVIGPKTLTGRTFSLSRGYDGKLYVEVPVNESAGVAELVSKAEMPNDVAARFRGCATLAALQKLAAEQGEEDAEHIARLKAAADKVAAARGFGLMAWTAVLKARTPKFLYFDEYYQMRGIENIQALQQRERENRLEKSDYPLLGLISLARLTLDELANPKRTQDLKNKLEGAGNHLSGKVLNYWSQNRHIQMRFDVRTALPEDPDGMRQGTNIWAEVYDSKHQATTEVGARSHGFVWFFSFLAWFTQKQQEKTPLILLLDEPGLALHGKAQGDLLRFIEKELRDKHQVLYTTHSPFMVDPAHLERVRIVQDRGMDEENVPRDEDGTKVFTDVLRASEDSLFPLQGALGYEMTQTLFVGPNCLVVEGASDLLYLQAVSGLLERQGRVSLDVRWTVTPVGGSDKVPAFVALFGAQRDLKVATLIDIQKKDAQNIENLYKRKLLEKKNVLTYGRFVGSNEADVEDMFGEDFYLELVNGEYGKAITPKVKKGALPAGGPRLLPRLEKYFEDKPMRDGAVFGHYRPARYFVERMADLEAKVPPEALDRFEAAFKALNALL